MFNDGDKAVVRVDLTAEEKEVWPEFIPEMEEYAGREVTIVKPYDPGRAVYIKEDGGEYAWLEEWFVPVEKFDAASSDELIDFLGVKK